MSMVILSQVREAIARVNPADIRETAERPVTIRMTALSSAGYVALEDFLAPRSVSRQKRYELAQYVFRDGDSAAPETVDIEIVEAGIEAPGDVFVFDPARPHQLLRAILDTREELGLALARAFPPFRRPVIDRLIHGIARENAVFSLMTSLPNLAPSISLPFDLPDISDTAFLTVNQIRLAFLVAAASDRPVGYREQRTEVASLIAGAFAWRTLARWLSKRFSLGAGVIPKAVLAYAGTYVAGMSLERLYRAGYGLTRQERDLAYGNALAQGRQVVSAILNIWRDREAERRYKQAKAAGLP